MAFSRKSDLVMAGDVNSNTICDNKHGVLDHTLMTARLKSLGLRSLCHVLNGVNHGEELTHTLYMYRNRAKGYHIDYVFVPDALIPIASLAIGHPDAWLPHSDHMPLTLDLATTHGPQ
jgi:endonuclease/exonuclease/phosphatase family metal-dependent hydrolase